MTQTQPEIFLPTLDRTRDFGTVSGDNIEHAGAFFEQDGFLFDVHGKIIEQYVTEAQRAELAARLRKEAALAKARQAFVDDLGMSAEDAAVAVSLSNLDKRDDGAIDLAAWARGEKRYPVDKVYRLIRESYDQSPTNRGQALEILAEHGVIPPVSGASTIPSAQ